MDVSSFLAYRGPELCITNNDKLFVNRLEIHISIDLHVCLSVQQTLLVYSTSTYSKIVYEKVHLWPTRFGLLFQWL